MEEALLYGKFQMLPSCNTFYDVSLSRKNIMFVEITSGKPHKLVSILMDNVIGCKLYNSKLNRDLCSYFKVITLHKGKKNIRQRHCYTFRVNCSENKDENYKIAENWARMLNWLIHDPQLSIEDLKAKECFPQQRKFYVAINPKSGPGKSLRWFRNTVEPLFKEANIKYEVLITEYSGHLTEKALTFDYTQWDGIVICSGDGLVYELVNGIMARPDWKEMMKLPIGILPTGSGNALATTLLYYAKEKFSVINAVYVLLKGRSHPMDIFSVSTLSKSYYAFLTVTWGFMSDADIESEKWRAIGKLRFTVSAIQRIFSLRHYTGTFSYLPGKSLKDVEYGSEVSEGECSSSSLSSPNENIQATNESIQATNESIQAANINIQVTNENIEAMDGTIQFSNGDIQAANENLSNDIEDISLKSDDAAMTQVGPGDPLSDGNVEMSQSSNSHSNISSSLHNSDKDGINIMYGPKSTLPNIDQPVPDGWVTVDGQFINIVLTSLSHIGSDLLCAPGTCIDDGVLNLQYIKRGPKTGTMIKLVTSFETGKHIEMPEVEIDNIKAFRLVPSLNNIGNIAVDGELIEYTAIQGEIYPSLGNVIMIPPSDL